MLLYVSEIPKETLINCLCGRIAALRGTRNLDYPFVNAFEKVNKKEQMAGLEPTSSIINPQYQSSRHHG